MKKAVVLSFLIILTLIPLANAQGFAISYPPGLQNLKIPAGKTYSFDVTLINNLGNELQVNIQSVGENVIIIAPLTATIPGGSTQKVHITIKAPDNVTVREFKGYVRFIVSVPGLGGKVAGSVTVPVAGEWEGVTASAPKTTASNTSTSGTHSTGQASGGTDQPQAGTNNSSKTTLITTVSSNGNLTPVNPASTLQNTTENTTDSDLISALIRKYNSTNSDNLGIENQTSDEENETNTTLVLEKAAPTSTLAAPTTLETTNNGGSNVLLYIVGAVVIGVVLSKYVRREETDEEGLTDDYYHGYGY